MRYKLTLALPLKIYRKARIRYIDKIFYLDVRNKYNNKNNRTVVKSKRQAYTYLRTLRKGFNDLSFKITSRKMLQKFQQVKSGMLNMYNLLYINVISTKIFLSKVQY